VLTVWTGIAFEKGERRVASLWRSENPRRHEAVPEVAKRNAAPKLQRGWRSLCRQGPRNGGGVQARYVRNV
jgi:hypothetical protein